MTDAEELTSAHDRHIELCGMVAEAVAVPDAVTATVIDGD